MNKKGKGGNNMELITFLRQEKELLKSILNYLEREKKALIKEDTKTLLEIIEEKEQQIHTLNKVEEKRNEIYPDLNLTKMEEMGLFTEELKEVGEKMRHLTQKISELQKTNQLLTQKSLEYTNKMLSIIQGNKKPVASAYRSNGKIGNSSTKGKSILDQSV